MANEPREGRAPRIALSIAAMLAAVAVATLLSSKFLVRVQVPPSSSAASGVSSPSPSDPTASWQEFHSVNGLFSLKHPTSWFVSPEGNSNGFVSVGMGNKHALGPYDYVTDIEAGSWPTSAKIDTSCFTLTTVSETRSVMVHGVIGSRKTGMLNTCRGGQSVDMTEYDFAANGRNYVFTFTSRPDAVPMSDFDLMVTNTVSFPA